MPASPWFQVLGGPCLMLINLRSSVLLVPDLQLCGPIALAWLITAFIIFSLSKEMYVGVENSVDLLNVLFLYYCQWMFRIFTSERIQFINLECHHDQKSAGLLSIAHSFFFFFLHCVPLFLKLIFKKTPLSQLLFLVKYEVDLILLLSCDTGEVLC